METLETLTRKLADIELALDAVSLHTGHDTQHLSYGSLVYPTDGEYTLIVYNIITDDIWKVYVNRYGTAVHRVSGT